MADSLKRYWFVAAVFREPHDLVSTITELRDNGFAGNNLLVVANHKTEGARKAVLDSEVRSVPVVGVRDGAIKAGPSLDLPAGLSTLLDSVKQSRTGDGAAERAGRGQPQVYAQLRQDVADGAVVLVASAADPEEQLLGARILLRGNCECVLTHEIAAESD